LGLFDWLTMASDDEDDDLNEIFSEELAANVRRRENTPAGIAEPIN